MRSLGTCYNEHAMRVYDPHYSSPSNKSLQSPNQIPQTPHSVIQIYRANLSTEKRLVITLYWCKNEFEACPIIRISDIFSCPSKSEEVTCILRNKKGFKILEYKNSSIRVSWDISKADYEERPEAIKNFYIAILCDLQICLLLGDMHEQVYVKKLKAEFPVAKFSLVSRNEHFSGDTIYATKAQFSDTGSMHDILIKCFSSLDDSSRSPVLSIEIDKKVFFQVKKLRWNFRGNESIYLDGLLVDVMWDVHDWFHNPKGCAMFLFKERSGSQCRLWLEENNMEHKKQDDNNEFSLLILASKDHG